MIEITDELRDKVISALLTQRKNYSGSDAAFATSYGINNTTFSSLKSGKREGLLSAQKWLELASSLDVTLNQREWKFARTEVFNVIEEDVLFCKNHSKSMIFVDDCEIGKTTAARYLRNSLPNCFYIDASQCKTSRLFVRALAAAVGVGANGKIDDLKAKIKQYLRCMPHPIIIIDEAGDLKHDTFLDLKEFWNATEKCCGWYFMGADGLREKIERGKRNERVGYAEMFSRMSSKYGSIVPRNPTEKKMFYRKLITDVLSVNMDNSQDIKKIVTRCLTTDETGQIGGLRRAESLLILEGM